MSYDFICDFEEFKNDVLKQCHLEEEISRVSEEIDLFTSRGWEKYVLLVVNTIRRMQKCGFYFPDYLGSAMDSYAIRLLTIADQSRSLYDKRESASDWQRKNNNFLKNAKKRGILFNDALRFTLTFHRLDLQKHGIEINNILESSMTELRLFYSEYLLNGKNPLPYGTRDTKDNLIIVSKDQKIPKDDEQWILSETRAVREGEAEILQKYLLLKVSVYGGL